MRRRQRRGETPGSLTCPSRTPRGRNHSPQTLQRQHLDLYPKRGRIYKPYPRSVPTRAVRDNLAFIQQRSSCAVWEQAPDSVRTATNLGTTYRPPTSEPKKKTLFPHAASKPKVTPPTTPKEPPKINKTQGGHNAHHDITDDTVTTQSQMTKSQTTTQNRFYKMKAAIRRQQNALQRHTAELQQVNERAVITMEICQATSTNILELRETTTNQLSEVRQEADRQANEQPESIARMTALSEQLTNQCHDNPRQLGTNAAHETPNYQIPPPKKKKRRN